VTGNSPANKPVEANRESPPTRISSNSWALSKREREVLVLLAEGQSNKEIAFSLNISVRTVEAHKSRVMSKLNLRSLAQLIRYAVKNKLVDI